MRLVADANVLLAAVIGGRARLILQSPEVSEILTTEDVLADVREYVVELAQRKRLSLDLVLLALAALPVRVIERADYDAAIPEARRRIGRRDPDDVELLALAIQFGLPLWSNDNDFEKCGIEWHTTAELLRRIRP